MNPFPGHSAVEVNSLQSHQLFRPIIMEQYRMIKTTSETTGNRLHFLDLQSPGSKSPVHRQRLMSDSWSTSRYLYGNETVPVESSIQKLSS